VTFLLGYVQKNEIYVLIGVSERESWQRRTHSHLQNFCRLFLVLVLATIYCSISRADVRARNWIERTDRDSDRQLLFIYNIYIQCRKREKSKHLVKRKEKRGEAHSRVTLSLIILVVCPTAVKIERETKRTYINTRYNKKKNFFKLIK